MNIDFLHSWEGKKYLEGEYHVNGRSLDDIAKERGTYANKIRRALIYHKIPLKDKSVAQKDALKSERAKPPMQGKQHSEDSKKKISQSIKEPKSN